MPSCGGLFAIGSVAPNSSSPEKRTGTPINTSGTSRWLPGIRVSREMAFDYVCYSFVTAFEKDRNRSSSGVQEIAHTRLEKPQSTGHVESGEMAERSHDFRCGMVEFSS